MINKNTIAPVDPAKVYRLLNIGPTTVVSAAFDGKVDALAVTWACNLDLMPCKASVVVDKTHYTCFNRKKRVLCATNSDGIDCKNRLGVPEASVKTTTPKNSSTRGQPSFIQDG